MSIPLALPAAPRPSRGTAPRGVLHHGSALAGSGEVVGRLVTGGALLNALALATFASLRCLGLLNLDTMALLPAAACAGAAAMSLGVVLACWRALRGA